VSIETKIDRLIGALNKNEALAYALAEHAHHGQKYGDHDYFFYHVLGVASEFDESDHEAYIVALLHDVIEDSGVEFYTVYKLFGIEIGDAVWLLTKPENQKYDEYIEVIAQQNCHPGRIARRVKIADLKFNLSQPELKNEAKYRKALAYLEAQS
jgi:(p)ppGpp synthase/HD superfamily hydrolase